MISHSELIRAIGIGGVPRKKCLMVCGLNTTCRYSLVDFVAHSFWFGHFYFDGNSSSQIALFQPFHLKPGIHIVSLRQQEHGFSFSKLAVVPTKISMWTDLGMQSRLIPDSSLSSNPREGRPPPRYGRLHAKGR